jgi:hypothetical protein
MGSLWMLPPSLWALWREIAHSLSPLGLVFAGAAGYLVLWRTVLQHKSISAFSTLEHELTHSLFAVLTGNRVTGLRVTLTGGGHMRYEGTPNWLIDVAPYFFPLGTICVMLALPFVPALHGLAGQVALGITLGYHLAAGWTQLHPEQTDLQKAGFVFCGMFLPTANAWSFGLTLAAARQGWSGMGQFLERATQAPWQWSLLW